MVKVLVCGGAGYIGSHVVKHLLDDTKHELVVVDDFSKGHSKSLPQDATVECGDIRDIEFLNRVFSKHKPEVVVHLCAFIAVGESCADPLQYYDNNVVGSIRLLQVMHKHNVKYFVFSSTAALFGTPERTPIQENDTIKPESPYGDTKACIENLLKWCDTAYGIKSVNLRYFNACGAHESGTIGEDHHPETHLLPIVLQVALGQREKVYIFGDDYDTPDGTCVRDYIHVSDLADAHIKAIEYLFEKSGESANFNLGNGKGYSVKEVIESCRRITGHSIPAEMSARRAGDPPVLVAGSQRAEEVLGWRPRYNLDEIIASAWKWHNSNPQGYNDMENNQ
eukprot:gb/GECH01006777.1/.p1 GENE.gb/GECH01006777.1/~~gb/GECH01006777.1/.p1  ORF type:complete len:337 (+),score=90.47 gb/GECH01006777.1/:1-1011(+)